LEDAANRKPIELERYLLKLSFSLQTNVNPKSIISPENPTIINFRNLKIIYCKDNYKMLNITDNIAESKPLIPTFFLFLHL
tara:strand:- start:598 stop:840 length:243 start_codon:yes stop_codon:yes gene_type:complete